MILINLPRNQHLIDANQSPGNPFWCLVDLVPIKNERHEVKDII